MKRIFFILTVVAATILTYITIHRTITSEARAALKSDCPELIWLKREYQLSDQQFGRIQVLHEQHDVECQNLCQSLAASQKKLRNAVAMESVNSETFQQALEEWRKQQIISQDSILKHMDEVSSEMDPENAKRYREAVFRNLILPGRTPHIDSDGEYNPEFILKLKE